MPLMSLRTDKVTAYCSGRRGSSPAPAMPLGLDSQSEPATLSRLHPGRCLGQVGLCGSVVVHELRGKEGFLQKTQRWLTVILVF
jgi:hypothetical protein